MRRPPHITEEVLQDYVDGELDDETESAVATWLLDHPTDASHVEKMRLINDALKSLGRDILNEPVPERLTELVRSSGREADLREKVAKGATNGPGGEAGAPTTATGTSSMAKEATLLVAGAVVLLAIGVLIGWFLA